MLHPLLQQIGMTVPIFQAPIGSIATAALAAAVSNAGGLGHLACTWKSAGQIGELIRRTRALTDHPFGVNFVLDFPVEDLLEEALASGVAAVSFFWGDGGRYYDRVKTGGAIAIQIVGSLSEARNAADQGADIVVVQGREAGGHVRGELGLISLLPAVVDAVSPIPVLAAGGIADRRGVEAALALGAAGVWVGTRFLVAQEADIHPHYRKRLLDASGDDTVLSTLFDIGWPNAPMRTLRSTLIEEWQRAGEPKHPFRSGEGETIAWRADGTPLPRYHFASPLSDMIGDIASMPLYAGAGVGSCRAIEPAGKIIAQLWTGY